MVELTAAEAAVYDRQLRVWGVETQKRLNAAKVLIVGCTGVAAEVAKNIVLAGVGKLSIMDDTPCSEAAPGNFLIPATATPTSSVSEESASSLQEMNPLVQVTHYPGNIGTAEVLNFVKDFNLLLLAGGSLRQMLELDKACTQHNVAFYAIVSRGPAGYFFANLHSHRYTPSTDMDSKGAKALSQQTITFAPLEQALFRPWTGLNLRKTNKLFFVVQGCALYEKSNGHFPTTADLQEVQRLALEYASAFAADNAQESLAKALPQDLLADFIEGTDELPAVNAILGGVLANEALKAVSFNGVPINNLLLFSLHDGMGEVETMS